MKDLAVADLEQRVVWLATQAGYLGLTEKELFARASAPLKELTRTLETSAARGKVVLVDKEQRRFLSGSVLAALQQRALTVLDRFHVERPEADGVPREELRQRLGVPHDKTFGRLLTPMLESKGVEADKELLRLPGRGRTYTEAASSLRADVLQALSTAGLQPPLVADLASRLRTPVPRMLELLQGLTAQGSLVRAGELFFAAAAIGTLEQKLVTFLGEHGSITTQQLKDLAGLSRKFLIPLAELFDARKVTLRVGETRVLRGKSA